MSLSDLREQNFYRLSELKKHGLSDDTIASIINDELKKKVSNHQKFTGQDVNSYLTLNGYAGKIVLVSKPAFDTIRQRKDEDDKNYNEMKNGLNAAYANLVSDVKRGIYEN